MYKSHHLQSNPISIFISIFNQGLHSKKENILLPYHHVINDLVLLFYSKQYISSYKYVTIPVYKNGKRVLLTYISITYVWYQNQSPFINLLKSYFLPSRKLYMTSNQLFDMKKKYKGRSLMVLVSTQKGLLWLDDCIKFQIGGFLLFEIL
jgi:ribosomal protein S8